MATAKSELFSRVASYAATFHEVIGYRHTVASPLGAWLLLACCGHAASGADRAVVAELLGGDPAQAAALAGELLATPHPLVAAAAALWSRPGAIDPAWLAGLPSALARGDVPDQAELDRWAREHTFGLIEKFPLKAAHSYLLLATALATKVSWDCPFELTAGSALGQSSPWAKKLARVLRSPIHPSHSAFICACERAGDVAVHVGQARGGLLVASVIGAADVAPATVLAAAYDIASATALGAPVPKRPLLDLPPGDWPLWSVRDEPSTDRVRQRCLAVLPAWTADDSHDLTDRRLGFPAALAGLASGDPWDARQAVLASYTRTGFEAAAVSAVAVRMAMLPNRGQRRTVELRFGHPYAVVAVAADADGAATPWRGLPVFSAWVEQPSNADDS